MKIFLAFLLICDIAQARVMGSKGKGKGSRPAKKPCPRGDTERWDFMKESFWYVPPAGLPSYNLDITNGNVQLLADQTVWKIEGYEYGYFWGYIVKLYTLNGQPVTDPLCSRTIATISPQCNVIMSGVRTDAQTSLFTTQGSGIIELQRDDSWVFTMQMANGNIGTQVASHWSPMAQCQEGEACWDQLPGLDMGVEDVLALCDLTTSFE